MFYNKGEPLNFDGDRTKNYIFKWLTKRLSHPVKEISISEYERLSISEQNQVSLVFHGELESIKGATFVNIAYQDNYNNYYYLKEPIKPYGTVDILRSFAPDEYYPFPNDQFQSWIYDHDRPAVVPLDDRSISSLFRDGKWGVLQFLQSKFENKRGQFLKAADIWKNKTDGIRLIFVDVPEQHQDYFGLLEYMDVNPRQTPILIINSETQKKYLLYVDPKDLLASKIIQFLEEFNAGKIKQIPLESEHAHHHHDHDDHHHHDHDHQHDHHHHHHHHHHEHDHHQHGHDHQHHHHHDEQSEQHEHDENCPHHHHHEDDKHIQKDEVKEQKQQSNIEERIKIQHSDQKQIKNESNDDSKIEESQL